MRKFFGKLAKLLLILYCLFTIFDILSKKEAYQWDFYGNYECAKALGVGVNPYDTDAVSKLAGKGTLPYAYPPITLQFFRMFTKFNYDTVFSLYLLLKVLLLTALIYLWGRMFLEKQAGIIFYFFCLFAFNSSIYNDFRSGNISILEQFIIWFAFLFYLRQKLVLFCIFIVLASIFKINPILFLVLVLCSESERKYPLFILSLIAFGLILQIQYLLNPSLFTDFVVNASCTIQEQGIFNPSSFSFFREVSLFISEALSVHLLSHAYIAMYFIFIAVVLSISGFSMALLKKINIRDKNKWALFLMCFVYALINVRFKDYSYILLIVPTYFFIKRVSSLKAQILLFILASVSATHINLPGFNVIFYFLWNYYPLIISFFVWVLYIREIIFLYKLHTVPVRRA